MVLVGDDYECLKYDQGSRSQSKKGRFHQAANLETSERNIDGSVSRYAHAEKIRINFEVNRKAGIARLSIYISLSRVGRVALYALQPLKCLSILLRL